MAGKHHLKVVTTNQVGRATVELNGEHVENGVSGVDLHLHVGEVNMATLELVAPTAEIEGEFEVLLREETQALLKRLGWTPPD
jgi:hypothetical protein